jgi:Zn-dependent protease
VDLEVLLTTFPAFVFALVFHEYAHAWMATRLGDGLAAWTGRLTLDPRAHADLMGTIILPLLGIATGGMLIGWARPVPFEPRSLRNPVRDTMLIAAAGPGANVLLAFLGAAALRVLQDFSGTLPVPLVLAGMKLLSGFLNVNIVLAVFNMIPLPPLDGSKVLAAFLPPGPREALLSLPNLVSFIGILALVNTGLPRVPMALLDAALRRLWGI